MLKLSLKLQSLAWQASVCVCVCVCVCVFAAPSLALTKWQTLITDWDTQSHHSWVFTPHLASDQRGSASANDNEASRPQQLMHLATNDD